MEIVALSSGLSAPNSFVLSGRRRYMKLNARHGFNTARPKTLGSIIKKDRRSSARILTNRLKMKMKAEMQVADEDFVHSSNRRRSECIRKKTVKNSCLLF